VSVIDLDEIRRFVALGDSAARHLPALVAEVERLRKVEAAAEALLGPWDDEWDCSGSPGHPQLTKAVVALRAALDAAQGGG